MITESAIQHHAEALEKSSELLSTRIGVIGVSFKTADISAREQLSRIVTTEVLENLKNDVRRKSKLNFECLILSTCNRIEVYFASTELTKARQLFRSLFSPENPRQFEADFQTYEFADQKSIQHIMKVAAGLDSMVVGEAQILRQMKEAVKSAGEKGLSGPVLHKLFFRAYKVGLEVREKYPKFTNGFRNSVSKSVVELIADYYKNGHRPTMLLVGTGKMIKLVVESLQDLLPARVILASRRNSIRIRADKTIPITEIGKSLMEDGVDVVISATASSEYVITAQHVAPLEGTKRNLLILDISVPRNVDPKIAEGFPNVKLLNLDDLKLLITNPELEARKSPENAKDLAEINEIISSRSIEFMNWLEESAEISPILTLLRKKADAVKTEELQNAISRLRELSPEERIVLERMSERIVKRLLHEPSSNLRRIARSGEIEKSKEYADLLKCLFSL